MLSTFKPSLVQPAHHHASDFMMLFHKDRALVMFHDDRYSLPLFSHIAALEIQVAGTQYLGTLDGSHCFAAELVTPPVLSEGFLLQPLRPLYRVLSPEQKGVAGMAFQVINWGRNHRYCGQCGTRTVQKHDERAMLCPACGLLAYPRVSPVVIVAVVKEGKLLLAHNRAMKNDIHSLVAGFVEVGESLEEAVQREVREEVGIEVGDIRYFGSEPWPFPGSLMAGFTACHVSGEIEVDGKEIDHAGWCLPGEFPPIPPPGSISRRLIDWYVEGTNPE